ncbi:MAG: M56 family metallopeptidase [Candidatus Bathyarchaeota archaeon]|nr:M56 family metallopeptidase [Candidatus Bathyarchaeota archaeon]
MAQAVSYSIATEIPASYMEKLFVFIYTQYLLPQKQRFTNFYRESTNGIPFISYTVLDTKGNPSLKAEVKGTIPVKVKLIPLDIGVSTTAIEEARQDIVIAVETFEVNARKATLYFAWREGEDIVPEELKKKEKSFRRMFFETQILFFVLFVGFGMVIFIVLASFYPAAFWIAPIVLIAVQFIFVFYSSNFISRTADWHITKANPIIHLLKYNLPIKSNDELKLTLPRNKVLAIKKEIYNEILAKRGEIDCVEAQKVFEKFGITCESENLAVKKVNVYDLVNKVSDKFGFSVPKIVVANTMVPNAAASGPSPSRGVILITTGLLVQLEEKEVISVIGHEFGHLKGRDPLLLYGLTSAEFLFRFYVLFGLFPIIFTSFLFIAYFWAVMMVIYFIAKFFEARADLVSAIKMGRPEVLASALEKIGFQRLLYERTPSFRLQEWLGLDPHPPIYFRVNRLQKLESQKEIKHPLIQSIKDVVIGFKESL